MDNIEIKNEKKKAGRPRIYNEVPDGPNRNRFINEVYKQVRYHSDPEYRQKKIDRNKRNYEARKLKKENEKKIKV
jgi:hypothetical protein